MVIAVVRGVFNLVQIRSTFVRTAINRYSPLAVGLMEIENLIRYTERAVGLMVFE